MALSKASCTGRGLIPAIGGHVHHMFDEGEDDLFALSLDDVMDDRPWTAEELMSGGAHPSSPNPALAPRPHLRRLLRSRRFGTRPTPAPLRRPRPLPAPQATRPRRRHFSLQRHRANRPTAPLCTAPRSCRSAARKPPVTRLDEPVAHQVVHDSWAAADLDETSTGMPALDVPVNPLFAANTTPRTMRTMQHIPTIPRQQARTGRIETEDYGTASSDYLTIRSLPRLLRITTSAKGRVRIVVYQRHGR